jgi:inosine-uridine nucleoside N-ribohydrolase
MAGRLRVVLDVDTGVDDAMALALATRLPGIELVAVTTVAGNVGIDNTTANTWRVLDWLGAGGVPIHRGLSRPLTGDAIDASHIHGESGLGGLVLPDPATDTQLRRPFAPEAIVDLVNAEPGALTLVFVGPLTNLAAAMALEPTLPSRIGRLVVMGGSLGRGNMTPYAEFNIGADPEASRQVFAACALTMVGLDVTQQVTVTRELSERLVGQTTPEATIVREATAHFFREGAVGSPHLHDPLAVGVALDPSLCTTKRGTVKIETATAWCAGRTTLEENADGPHEVCVTVDSARFLDLFTERLGLSG